MTKVYPLRIDAYAHIAPQKFRERLAKVAPKDCAHMIDPFPALYDMGHRFRAMDRYEGLVQVLAPSWPSVEVTAPSKAMDLAKVVNDGIAKLVAEYPERFLAGIACLPLNNMKTALKETDRAIEETINAIEKMDITEQDRTKMYDENARKLYRLPI